LESLLEDFHARSYLYVAAFFIQMVQLHPEDDYVMVVEAKAGDPVIATTKVQAQA
jgi:hypothetical protein